MCNSNCLPHTCYISQPLRIVHSLHLAGCDFLDSSFVYPSYPICRNTFHSNVLDKSFLTVTFSMSGKYISDISCLSIQPEYFPLLFCWPATNSEFWNKMTFFCWIQWCEYAESSSAAASLFFKASLLHKYNQTAIRKISFMAARIYFKIIQKIMALSAANTNNKQVNSLKNTVCSTLPQVN